ncbi:hypothetical protein FRC14_007337 [Serendipita sp. 396]|nr:hypothetical protein FRC14_007337 [Serendipita sp. 396]KAG8777696.1 hypothetical protein FRC15_011168 [Serendipita sp. 397]KAG8862842.1 hypothetical protein FRC20_011021 [Serendipita sp. 405]
MVLGPLKVTSIASFKSHSDMNPNIQKHEKWIQCIILISILFAIVEFGISVGDKLHGRHSLWTAPIVAVLAVGVLSGTLLAWDITAERYREMGKPSFIYSITLCVLSFLLALLWLISTIVTLVVLYAVDLHIGVETSSKNRYRPSEGIVEGILALVNSVLSWVLFGLVVHSRKLFLIKIEECDPEMPEPVPNPPSGLTLNPNTTLPNPSTSTSNLDSTPRLVALHPQSDPPQCSSPVPNRPTTTSQV